MSETIPAGPFMPEEQSRKGDWIHFVPPQPATPDLRHTKNLLRRAAGECAAWAVVLAVAVALLAPVAGFLVAGGWAVYTYTLTLLTLWQQVRSYQLSNLVPLLDALDLAGRVALASAGYFALLSALLVLMAGLLGTRWRRLFLFPGFTFTLPSALAFFFGLRLSLDAKTAPLHLPPLAQTALLAYLLLDAIVLAALLVDVSPRKKRQRRLLRRRWGRRRTPSVPLAPIHFGPSGPLSVNLADDNETLIALPAVPTTCGEPSISTSAMEVSQPGISITGAAPPPPVPAPTAEQTGADIDTAAALTASAAPLAPVS